MSPTTKQKVIETGIKTDYFNGRIQVVPFGLFARNKILTESLAAGEVKPKTGDVRNFYAVEWIAHGGLNGFKQGVDFFDPINQVLLPSKYLDLAEQLYVSGPRISNRYSLLSSRTIFGRSDIALFVTPEQICLDFDIHVIYPKGIVVLEPVPLVNIYRGEIDPRTGVPLFRVVKDQHGKPVKDKDTGELKQDMQYLFSLPPDNTGCLWQPNRDPERAAFLAPIMRVLPSDPDSTISPRDVYLLYPPTQEFEVLAEPRLSP
jgi:hypothetical protein